MKTALESMLPDFDYPENTKATVIGDKIVFVTIGHDEDCPDPTDDDGMGRMYSFSSSHRNRLDYRKGLEILRTNPDAVALSYYEHGACRWSVAGDLPRSAGGPHWEFDGVDLAGVWVPDKYTTEAYDPMSLTMGDRRAWFVEQAKSTCEIYTQWVNGECYFYSIEVYQVRRAEAVGFVSDGEVYDLLSDYRKDKPVFEDSCHGFIGDEYIKEEVLSLLKEYAPEDNSVQDKGGVASTV